MSQILTFRINSASAAQIGRHLQLCDDGFIPPLSERVDIENYSRQLTEKAQRNEMWMGEDLVGLVAAYCNNWEKRVAFITNVSILPDWQRHGIASRLISYCIDQVRGLNFKRIELEVGLHNNTAIRLYQKHGFEIANTNCELVNMYLAI